LASCPESLGNPIILVVFPKLADQNNPVILAGISAGQASVLADVAHIDPLVLFCAFNPIRT